MQSLHDPTLRKNANRAGASQDYLDIEEIRNDVVILKNGSLRSVVMCSSVNFALKSTQEQEALIAGYQQFLNSVDFPVQIVINSRAMDISNYLAFLDEKYRDQTNELLKLQITEYKAFIKGLVEVADIMTKRFYVVVPFTILESGEDTSIGSRFKSLFNPKKTITQTDENFQKYKAQLWQRVNHVIQGLSGMGVQAEALKTQELIELYYSLYNPSSHGSIQRLADVGNLDIENVR